MLTETTVADRLHPNWEIRFRYRFLGLTTLLLTALSISSCRFGDRDPDPDVAQQATPVKTEMVRNDSYTMSGPYTQNNLSIYLVHGKSTLDDANLLTLQESMARGTVVVHETQNVESLEVENLSEEKSVFIQAGEIVKGGQQDRVLVTDMILPPKSGSVPIESFCVEHGRWSARGTENSETFASSDYFVADKDLKIAAKGQRSQNDVWEQVEEVQEKLSNSLETDVASEVSESSLQLALEHGEVETEAKAYINALEKIAEGKKDVIGYAFVINGRINSADVYASHGLFTQLWPKLLKSTAIEAVAERDGPLSEEIPTAQTIALFLSDAGKGEAKVYQINEHNRLVTNETDDYLMFESRVGSAGATTIHKNFIVK